jgi:hypothetical protein
VGKKGSGKGNTNNSRNEGKGMKGILMGAETDSTVEGIGDNSSLQSAVYVPNSKDTTSDVSEGHIRSWSPTFRKHHIEELAIDTELDYLEDMEVVVEKSSRKTGLSHGGRTRTVPTGDYCGSHSS